MSIDVATHLWCEARKMSGAQFPWLSSDFPGSPDTMFPLQGAWVWSLVRALRSWMLCCMVNINKSWASQVALVVKNPPSSAGDLRVAGSIPGSGRSLGGGHGNPCQYSCLKNLTDRGAWRAIVHRVAKSWIWLKLLSTHSSHMKEYIVSKLDHPKCWNLILLALPPTNCCF